MSRDNQVGYDDSNDNQESFTHIIIITDQSSSGKKYQKKITFLISYKY